MTADPPFSPSDVLLLGPGPSPVPSIVSRALAAPTLGHLDPEFLTLMDRVRDGLRAVIGTSARFTLPLSATGSAGMEAAFVNLVEPGDRVVVGVHGLCFGHCFKGCVVWGLPVDAHTDDAGKVRIFDCQP